MSGIITNAGMKYIAERMSSLEPVVVSKFILANVANIDEGTIADPDAALPSAAEIVDEILITKQPHYNDDNAVTYSLVLNSDKGDYDFNYYAEVTDTGVLLAYQYIPLVKKRKGIGQVINRNAVITFSNARFLTGANVPVESWQYDYESEIHTLQLTQIKNAVAQMSLMNSMMNQHERLFKLEGKL